MEGAPHTAKRRLGVSLGCPPPTYIKGGGEVAGPRGGAPWGESYLNPVQVGFAPPFLFPLGEGGKEEEEERRKEGGAAPSPCPIRIAKGGATSWPALSVLHEGP